MAKGETLSQRLCPKTSEEKEQLSKVPYLSAIGSLMYAMICTRPNICHAIGMPNCDTPTWHLCVRKGCHETVDFKPD